MRKQVPLVIATCLVVAIAGALIPTSQASPVVITRVPTTMVTMVGNTNSTDTSLNR